VKVDGVEAASVARGAPPSDAALSVITPGQVVEKISRAGRALLLKEIAPNHTEIAIEKTISVLVRMRAAGVLRFNAQTDRWSLAQHDTR